MDRPDVLERLGSDVADRRGASRLPHPFTTGDRAAGIRYDFSVLQAESP